jgi:hypothetical protein
LINELLDSLRYRSEGTDIDFKSKQYRFSGASEKEKSELLKDILAIANAWRDGVGYILIGFQDQRPNPASVVGIGDSIDDAALQQFVNGKVKPKLTFKYEEHLYDGHTIGVITIPKQQRAFYLSNAYGGLKSNVVYVRRGSSTDEAEPREIVQMTLEDSGRREMRVELLVLDRSNQKLAETFALTYLQFPDRLPNFESAQKANGADDVIFYQSGNENRNFWREYAKFARIRHACIEMKFVVQNVSQMQLSNAKLEVKVEALDRQSFEMFAGSDLPDQPEPTWDLNTLNFGVPKRHDPRFIIDESGTSRICSVRFGSLLPGEDCTSADSLAIVPNGPGKFRLCFRILGGELAEPRQSECVLDATGVASKLDFRGLVNLCSKASVERKTKP